MRLVPLRGGRKPEVQMSPLIDVIFLLLIFYAVTTQFVSDERLKLKLPEAETAESVGVSQEERPPEVKIAADGSIWIDDQIVPESELEAQMRQLVERAPDDGIILKGDKGKGRRQGDSDERRQAGRTVILSAGWHPHSELRELALLARMTNDGSSFRVGPQKAAVTLMSLEATQGPLGLTKPVISTRSGSSGLSGQSVIPSEAAGRVEESVGRPGARFKKCVCPCAHR